MILEILSNWQNIIFDLALGTSFTYTKIRPYLIWRWSNFTYYTWEMVLDHGKFWKDSRDKGGSTLENFDSLMGQRTLGPVSLHFTQKLRRSDNGMYGKFTNLMLRLQLIAHNWWIWFQNQKNDQILQINWMT